MIKLIKVQPKPVELTLNGLLETLREENTYIRRIRQDEQFIIIETSYNCSQNALS